MTPFPSRPGRIRPVFLLLAVVVLLGVGGFVVYQKWASILNSFEDDREDAAALAALASTPVTPALPVAAEVGWPQWRGPNRDGLAPSGPLRTNWKESPPKPLWSVPCGGGYASFAVVGNRLYTQDYKDGTERILCLDAATGATIWTHGDSVPYSGLGFPSGPRATPTIHEGRVYTVGAKGLFLCLDANPDSPQGKELWRHDLLAEFRADLPTWGIASAPLIEGDLVIVQPGGRDGTIAAFDRKTGAKRWATGKNPNGYSSPIAATLGGVRQIVAVTGDAIIGVRPSDGQQLWSHPWITEHKGNIATPVVVDVNHVFVSSGYQKGCVLLQIAADGDGAKAKELYFRKSRVMRNHHSSCVVRGESLYGYDDNTLRCVDWRKGAAKDDWEGTDNNGRTLRKGSVILSDKYLIGLTETGTLFLGEAAPDEFRFLGQVPNVLAGAECWALPVLVDGRLYLRDAAKIVCLDVR